MTPFRQWLRLFLPVAVGAGLAVAASARLQYQTELRDRIGRESTGLAMADQDLARRLLDASQDLRVIADSPALAAHVIGSDETERDALEQLLGSFIEQKPLFDAFALYDERATTTIRMQRSGSGTAERQPSAPQAAEQIRAFADTADLAPRSIRVSGFELLQDGDEVVRPLRPIIYMSMRLTLAGSEQVLLARLRGALVLHSMEEILSDAVTQTWLLDHQGYWLLHPDSRMTWGLQLDPGRRLDRRAPHLVGIQERAEGMLREREGFYVFRRFQDLAAAASEAGLELPGPVHAVQLVPPQALPSPWPLLHLVLGALGLLLWAGASAGHVHLRHRAAVSEQRSQALLAENRRVTEEQAWVREQIYHLSLAANAAADLRGFCETFLAELARSLKLCAACLYRVHEGRCLLVAAYGLQHGEVPREFASGQGLVGEVARTREARRVASPPAGYLDLLSGLGGGTAAELRILPLNIHEHALGVLELACVDVLDARQEALLNQLLPLLALNLAGRTGGLRSKR